MYNFLDKYTSFFTEVQNFKKYDELTNSQFFLKLYPKSKDFNIFIQPANEEKTSVNEYIQLFKITKGSKASNFSPDYSTPYSVNKFKVFPTKDPRLNVTNSNIEHQANLLLE